MAGSLGCLGVVAVLTVIGMIGSTYEEKEKAATEVAQQAKSDAFQKTPAYRAQAKAEKERRRAESARKSQARRDAKAQETKAQNTEINIIKDNAKSIEKLLIKANSTSDGELFSTFSVDGGDKLTLTTTPNFDALPYRSRLQIATLLDRAWNALCDRTSNHKVALFHMEDIVGNKVGGANVLSGVWVVEQ
jgi:type II secretory pathway pseudopilin PulG